MPRSGDPKKCILSEDIAPYVKGPAPEHKLDSRAAVTGVLKKIAEFFKTNPEKEKLILSGFKRTYRASAYLEAAELGINPSRIVGYIPSAGESAKANRSYQKAIEKNATALLSQTPFENLSPEKKLRLPVTLKEEKYLRKMLEEDENIEILNEKGAVRQLMPSLVVMDSKNERLRIPALFGNEKLSEETRKEMREVLQEMMRCHDQGSEVYTTCSSILLRLEEQPENASSDLAATSSSYRRGR